MTTASDLHAIRKELTMESASGVDVSGGRLLRGVERAEAVPSLLGPNRRAPSSRRLLPHTFKAGRVVPIDGRVHRVLCASADPKVRDAVVALVSVDVVDVAGRPLSEVEQPCESVQLDAPSTS